MTNKTKIKSRSGRRDVYKKFLQDLRNNKLPGSRSIKNKKTNKNQLYDPKLGIWFSKSKRSHSASPRRSRRSSRRRSRRPRRSRASRKTKRHVSRRRSRAKHQKSRRRSRAKHQKSRRRSTRHRYKVQSGAVSDTKKSQPRVISTQLKPAGRGRAEAKRRKEMNKMLESFGSMNIKSGSAAAPTPHESGAELAAQLGSLSLKPKSLGLDRKGSSTRFHYSWDDEGKAWWINRIDRVLPWANIHLTRSAYGDLRRARRAFNHLANEEIDEEILDRLEPILSAAEAEIARERDTSDQAESPIGSVESTGQWGDPNIVSRPWPELDGVDVQRVPAAREWGDDSIDSTQW